MSIAPYKSRHLFSLLLLAVKNSLRLFSFSFSTKKTTTKWRRTATGSRFETTTTTTTTTGTTKKKEKETTKETIRSSISDAAAAAIFKSDAGVEIYDLATSAHRFPSRDTQSKSKSKNSVKLGKNLPIPNNQPTKLGKTR